MAEQTEAGNSGGAPVDARGVAIENATKVEATPYVGQNRNSTQGAGRENGDATMSEPTPLGEPLLAFRAGQFVGELARRGYTVAPEVANGAYTNQFTLEFGAGPDALRVTLQIEDIQPIVKPF